MANTYTVCSFEGDCIREGEENFLNTSLKGYEIKYIKI